MATYKGLTDQSGIFTEISSPDILSVGSGVTTSSGNLTIDSAGGTTTLSDSNVVISGTLSAGSLLITALSSGGFNTAGGQTLKVDIDEKIS